MVAVKHIQKSLLGLTKDWGNIFITLSYQMLTWKHFQQIQKQMSLLYVCVQVWDNIRRGMLQDKFQSFVILNSTHYETSQITLLLNNV